MSTYMTSTPSTHKHPSPPPSILSNLISMDATKNLHVLIFPFPAQGHVNSMLKLAELLCLSNIHVTFLLSKTIHVSLLRNTNIQNRLKTYPGILHIETLPGELFEGKFNTVEQICRLFDSIEVVKPFLREILINPNKGSKKTPITSIIADGILSVALDVGEEMGVPVFIFRTISACAFWAYFSIPLLIQGGDLPFTGDDRDVPVTKVKGMEQILRRRDLPSPCQVNDLTTPEFKILMDETQKTTRSKGLILNTFDDLEGNIISQIRSQCPNVYSIGPVHTFPKTRNPTTSASSNNNSFLKEDTSCMKWLDQQATKSVLYVSFGSTTTFTSDQMLEFWHGIVNSNTRFLWVIRPDSIKGINKQPKELEEAAKARGYFVEWAPQEAVLGHPAIGGFLTHCGWNSTIESIAEGVPMICWPFFADQQINSRFVEKVWKLGVDMKDTCDRLIVEKMVRDLMEARKKEFEERANEVSQSARQAVNEGGSSSRNLERLIEDIRLMSKEI